MGSISQNFGERTLSLWTVTVAAIFLRICSAIASRFRNLFYRCLGVKLGGYSWLRRIEIPRNWSDICLDHCALDKGVVLLCSGPSHSQKLVIGRGTYINRYSMIDAHREVRIGTDVMIGPHCYITDGNHGTSEGIPVKFQPMVAEKVIIEDEVWIGAHVSILAGVTIKSGAVIGAGSVVTSDIPANAIAFGSPARVRRYREGDGNE